MGFEQSKGLKQNTLLKFGQAFKFTKPLPLKIVLKNFKKHFVLIYSIILYIKKQNEHYNKKEY